MIRNGKAARGSYSNGLNSPEKYSAQRYDISRVKARRGLFLRTKDGEFIAISKIYRLRESFNGYNFCCKDGNIYKWFTTANKKLYKLINGGMVIC